VHEALYFGNELDHILFNPNQLRDNGITVEDVPRQYDRTSTHSIYIPEHELRIPLSLDGIISGFECQKPTWEEYENNPKIKLMADRLWQPHSDDFAEKERRVSTVSSKAYYETLLLQHNTNCQISDARAVYNATMTPHPYDEEDMASLMIAQVKVATDDHDGDGLTGRLDEIIYPPNEDRRRITNPSLSSFTISLSSCLPPKQRGVTNVRVVVVFIKMNAPFEITLPTVKVANERSLNPHW
jgi:hypothetical protein